MDRVLAYSEPYDAVVLAGFGEPGRDRRQELIEQPVVALVPHTGGLAMMAPPAPATLA
jgi:allantoin racemase